MKRIYIICIIVLLFLIQCSTQLIEPETKNEGNQEQINGKLSLNLNMSNAPSNVASIEGILYSNNQDTIFFNFEISSNSATANVEDLMAGMWSLIVDAFDNEDHRIYTGSTDVNIKSGVTTSVNLHLNPTNGNLDIQVTWGEETLTDIDGNKYKTIRIGDQVWMAENLKVTRYRNGDFIIDGTEIGDYSEEITPKYRFVYNDNEENVNIYGRLYTWYVVNDERNICPVGWRIPTDKDFKELEYFLGMSMQNIDSICALDNEISGKLKEVGFSHWLSPNSGATNESGFTALPGGYRRRYANEFDYMGKYGCFWSSTEQDENNAWYRHLYSDTAGICRTYNLKNYGFSVRCIKDEG